MKKVLLLCTTHNDLGSIRALKKMGMYIIATGNIENLPGQKWVDKYIKADYSNQDMILEIAKKEEIDYICACCNDYGVYTAAYVAQELGLPGYDDYNTVLTLHNKDLFKEFSKRNDIQTPISEGFSDMDSAIEFVREEKLPLIVKPVDCSAGNGISVINQMEDANNAIQKAFSESRASRIVIEPYVKGSQHGFCTFLLNQKVVAVCSNNEYSFENPYRVEIDTFPATDWTIYNDFLIEQVEKIASILKLKDGIFHLQYIVSDHKPWIIEVMRRTIGNMYHVLGNELNGINWEYWETRVRCGMDCDGFPQNVKQEGYFAYKTILAPTNGIIEEIVIPPEYEKYVFRKIMLMKKGDEVQKYLSQPIGLLFFMFKSEEEMIEVLIKNYRNDCVKVK